MLILKRAIVSLVIPLVAAVMYAIALVSDFHTSVSILIVAIFCFLCLFLLAVKDPAEWPMSVAFLLALLGTVLLSVTAYMGRGAQPEDFSKILFSTFGYGFVFIAMGVYIFKDTISRSCSDVEV